MRKGALAIFVVVSFCSTCTKSSQPAVATITSLVVSEATKGTGHSMEYASPLTDTLDYELALGDAPESLNLEIKGPSNAVVSVRYVTSLAVSDEGSHLDLTNWKHHESEWKPANRQTRGAYSIGYDGEIDSERFPEVTTGDIVGAIPSDANAKWRKIAERCTTPTTMPCYVIISHYLVRIQAPAANPVYLRIRVPMGD